jgi:hypothetical protein
VVLEKYGEDQLDTSCEKLWSVILSQGGEEYPTYNKKRWNSTYIGRKLSRNCLLKTLLNERYKGREGEEKYINR